MRLLLLGDAIPPGILAPPELTDRLARLFDLTRHLHPYSSVIEEVVEGVLTKFASSQSVSPGYPLPARPVPFVPR